MHLRILLQCLSVNQVGENIYHYHSVWFCRLPPAANAYTNIGISLCKKQLVSYLLGQWDTQVPLYWCVGASSNTKDLSPPYELGFEWPKPKHNRWRFGDSKKGCKKCSILSKKSALCSENGEGNYTLDLCYMFHEILLPTQISKGYSSSMDISEAWSVQTCTATKRFVTLHFLWMDKNITHSNKWSGATIGIHL